MLSLYEFTRLSIEEKAQYLWNKGCFLLSRIHGRHKIELYAVESFYVEAWLERDDAEKDNIIVNIRPFKSICNLDIYLKRIKINYSHKL